MRYTISGAWPAAIVSQGDEASRSASDRHRASGTVVCV